MHYVDYIHLIGPWEFSTTKDRSVAELMIIGLATLKKADVHFSHYNTNFTNSFKESQD
jgi:hypothetical protein